MVEKCKYCFEKKRADYWFQVSNILVSILGGSIGAVIAFLIICLSGN